jgi:hypothetical protein
MLLNLRDRERHPRVCQTTNGAVVDDQPYITQPPKTGTRLCRSRQFQASSISLTVEVAPGVETVSASFSAPALIRRRTFSLQALYTALSNSRSKPTACVSANGRNCIITTAHNPRFGSIQ